jgi:hypothetical protein
VLGEPDMEIREAFVLWQMQEMNIGEVTIEPDKAEDMDPSEHKPIV